MEFRSNVNAETLKILENKGEKNHCNFGVQKDFLNKIQKPKPIKEKY
jgi:hypothetical protein